MTSEEGDENPSSSGTVMNGNPPMTHVSTDVLKEFISRTPDRSTSSLSSPNSNFNKFDKKMQLIACSGSSNENPVKKIRLDSSSETSSSGEKANTNLVVSTRHISPEIADNKSAVVLPAEFEKANGNSTIPSLAESSSKTSIVPYSKSLLLAMSSSSISLTPKLQNEQPTKLIVPGDKSKENSQSEERPPFTSSVSLTMKTVPNSSLKSKETSTFTEKAFPLPKSSKNVPPSESLSDLEKKIVGSVSISPKNVDKLLNNSFKSADEMENIDDLLNPGSPFSDTSSHISLSLEESLLRDDDDLETEMNPISNVTECTLKNDKYKVKNKLVESEEMLPKEKNNGKDNELANDTDKKKTLPQKINGEVTNSSQTKDEASDQLKDSVVQSDKVNKMDKQPTKHKCDTSVNAKDSNTEKKNDNTSNDSMDKNQVGSDFFKDDIKIDSLHLLKDIDKNETKIEKHTECKSENKDSLTERNSEKKVDESKKITDKSQLNIAKSSSNMTHDIADDIFEADEGSVEDLNETNFAVFDEKDDYNDDSDEETIKPAVNLLIGTLAKDIRRKDFEGSGSYKHSSSDQDDESSTKSNKIDENAININADECKSNSSSKEISSSLQMDVSVGSISSATMSASSQMEENTEKNESHKEQITINNISEQSKSPLTPANKSIKETLQSSNSKEKDLNTKVNTKTSSSLTFTEALKSIEADSGDMFPSLKSELTPLKPSAEFISTEMTSSKSSFTVLQPALKRPIRDISNERTGTSSLKKMRFFHEDKDPLAKDSDVEKADDPTKELVDMENFLQKEKANFDTTDKRSMSDVDPEELRRRTAIELEKVKPLKKSLPKVQRIKRKDLESLVVELFMDKVLYEHELGQQRDLCKRLEATLETNRKKAAQFHKEVEDLKKVTQRLQNDHISRKGQVVAPVKVKRSVGIQATPAIIGKGLMHATSLNNTIRLISPSNSVSRPTTPPKVTPIENCPSAPVVGNKNLRPIAPKRQFNNNKTTTANKTSTPANKTSPAANKTSTMTNKTSTAANITTTTAVQTNSSVVVGGSAGKMRQIQTTRVVVSQPASTPSSQANGNSLVMVNSSQQIISTTGPVSTMTPSGVNRFVRATTAPVPVSGAQGLINSSPLPVANIVQRVPVANSGVSGLIDLTDDDDNKGVVPQQARIATSAILVPRSTAGTTSQFVTIPHQSQMGQLLLVPSSTGSPTTALVVGNMPGTTQATLMSGANTIMRPNILSANSQRLTLGTRVVVGTQVNGGTMLQTMPRPKHPAPLPEVLPQEVVLPGYSKKLPPVPILKLSHKENSIVLSWNMIKTDEHDVISSYQLFAYQEGTAQPSPSLWKKVGSVKALELPMACTLTQFMPGHVYHFAVRAVDAKCRSGPFSEPKSIRLQKQVTM